MAAAAAVSLVPLPASAALHVAAIYGFWRTPDGGRIEIHPCGDMLCGHIRDDGIDDGKPTHAGHLLLQALHYQGALTWAGGTVLNPRDNRAYRAKLRLMNGNQLKLTGCAWIFCGSQVWTRIE